MLGSSSPTSTAVRGIAVGLTFAAGALALVGCSGSSSSDSSSSPAASGSGLPVITADEALASRVPADIKSTGAITFGTDASYPPSEFIGEDGSTIRGFDVDLGKAIAKKLGLDGKFENAAFDSLIVGVTKGKYNGSMSSFTINAEREKQVNMVSYFTAGTAWAVATGNPMNITPSTACGKAVAVQKATVQVDDIVAKSKDCTSNGKPAIKVEQYNLQSDATTALVSGKVDAMLADSPVVAYAIKQTSGKIQQTGEIYGAAPYGVAIAKGDTAFATLIQQALAKLIQEGSYIKILQAWGVESGAITTPELNPPPN